MTAATQLPQVSNLDHLGIVAGMIDEIGLVEKINELVGEQRGEKVSPGHAVKAMILNGLGLVSAPLYLFSQFFVGKATEHLIGEGIRPEHLNDDRLGRVLDKLYLTGLSPLFAAIALEAARKFQVSLKTSHLDSSSFSVEGEYNQNRPEVKFLSSKPGENGEIETEETTAPHAIKITYGYSRDRRPDLKQFVLDLVCSGDGDIPVYLKAGDGNEADKTQFPLILKEFKKQLNIDCLMVADSGLFSEKNLKDLSSLKWLSRVPLSIKEAKQLVSQLTESDFTPSRVEGYQWSVHQSNYGGVEQRWLVVESAVRREADLRKLQKQIDREKAQALQQLRQLSREEFACISDAVKAANQREKKWKYHRLDQGETLTVPLKSRQKTTAISYKVQANLVVNLVAIAAETQAAGRFVLATNVLDESELSSDNMLIEYKQQQSAERGFGFLKDPLFFTDSVFLKSPERISALALIMGLCLLVYTLAQRQLRLSLKSAQSGIKNQLGKMTERPTLRWIFQTFQALHLLLIDGVKYISNLTDERLRVLQFFPKACQQYYLLP